jgi:hypothetical protein
MTSIPIEQIEQAGRLTLNEIAQLVARVRELEEQEQVLTIHRDSLAQIRREQAAEIERLNKEVERLRGLTQRMNRHTK